MLWPPRRIFARTQVEGEFVERASRCALHAPLVGGVALRQVTTLPWSRAPFLSARASGCSRLFYRRRKIKTIAKA